MTSVLKVDTIQNSSGSSDWYPNPPRFFIGLSAGQTGLTENTSVTVELNLVKLDSASGYDATNYWYEIPETGCYWISAAVLIDEQSGSTLRDAIGWVEVSTDSGSTWTEILNSGFRYNANDAEGATVTMSGVHELTSGTLVRLRAFSNNTDSTVYSIRPDTYGFNTSPSMTYGPTGSGTHLTGYRIA